MPLVEEEYVTGYQYSNVDSHYIGEYRFPRNKDSDTLHMPPYTVLLEPPTHDINTQEAYWTGEAWEIRDRVIVREERPEIEDYEMLTPYYIDYLIGRGQWSPEDQSRRDAALEAASIRATNAALFNKRLELSAAATKLKQRLETLKSGT